MKHFMTTYRDSWVAQRTPAQITDEVYKAVFIRGLYNKSIKRKAHDYPNMKTLGDTFRAARMVRTQLKANEDIECLNDSDDDTNKVGNNKPSDGTAPIAQAINQIDGDIINMIMDTPLPTPLELCIHCICEINGMLPPNKQQQHLPFYGYYYRCGRQGHMSRQCTTAKPTTPNNSQFES